jgi:hypothetical protein
MGLNEKTLYTRLVLFVNKRVDNFIKTKTADPCGSAVFILLRTTLK